MAIIISFERTLTIFILQCLARIVQDYSKITPLNQDLDKKSPSCKKLQDSSIWCFSRDKPFVKKFHALALDNFPCSTWTGIKL